MQIFKEIGPLKEHLRRKKQDGVSIGLVPTMGALHKGHISLIEAAKEATAHTVASIFVNPTQFNNPADLEKYPRTPDVDIKLLEAAGCDTLFAPEVDEMYKKPGVIHFDFGQLDKVLEGKFRPGHFSGVATVVSKLFNIVEPDVAVFGQKDYQQLQVITRLVEDLSFNIRIISAPTLREHGGLAMSSRNLRLSDEQKKKALVLYESLTWSRQQLLEGASWAAIQKSVESKIASVEEAKLEYFELAHRDNLVKLFNADGAEAAFDPHEGVILAACFVGPVRLIDNMLV